MLTKSSNVSDDETSSFKRSASMDPTALLNDIASAFTVKPNLNAGTDAKIEQKTTPLEDGTTSKASKNSSISAAIERTSRSLQFYTTGPSYPAFGDEDGISLAAESGCSKSRKLEHQDLSETVDTFEE